MPTRTAITIFQAHRMDRWLCFGVVLIWLAGCAPRADMVPDAAALTGETIVPVYVGTTRAQEAAGVWSSKFAGPLTYARVDVSVPKTRRPGIVMLPGMHPDPDRHFLTREVASFSGRAAFREEVARTLASDRITDKEVVVTIHGFNNTLGDGVFRTAQMIRDFDIDALTVHYAWPSRGAPLGYAADRDAVLIARDGLEQMLEDLGRAGARDIVLVAHSMGAQLTMEVLRQMAIRKAEAMLSRISAVVLLSPDIAPSVFRAQAEAIGDLPDPFVIFTSQNDPALRLSARLTGVPRRLGNITGVEEVAGLNVTVINLSSAQDAASNHLAALTSPSVISFLKQTEAVRRNLETDPSGRAGLLPGTMLLAQEATAIMLAPVALVERAGN
ncbi:alpha/beta hydrolase [Roseovarius mucosus]|uniref:alpha/beta hydrolase n=1 Tax=Roseovarius mucosus TaxID=215743 RepID=UPI003F720A60